MRLFLRSLLMLGTLIAATAFAAPSANAADCMVEPVWSGAGPTVTVPAGGSIQGAINNATTGSTVVVANGSYGGFTLNKNVRVVAQNRYGATITGSVTQTAGWLDGFVLNATTSSSGATGTVVYTNNRAVSGSGQLWTAFKATAKFYVWGNDFRDTDTLTDYAVQFYGTANAEVCHNYFFGQYNQVVSFKEGNRDYTMAYNTGEGGQNGAGLFAGQNANTNGLGYDTGLISIHHNHWQRAVNGDSSTRYRAKDPIRTGYLRNADVRIHDNVVVGAYDAPIYFWPSGWTGSGTIRMTNNAVANRANGSVEAGSCVIRQSLGYSISSDGLKCWDASSVVSGGGVTLTNTTTGSNPQTLQAGPNPRFDPDLHLLPSTTPTPTPTPEPTATPTPEPTATPTPEPPVTTTHTVDSDTFVCADTTVIGCTGTPADKNTGPVLAIDGSPVRRTLLAWDDVPAGATAVKLLLKVDWAVGEGFAVRKGTCAYEPPLVTFASAPVPGAMPLATVATDVPAGSVKGKQPDTAPPLEITLPAAQFTQGWNCLQVDKTGIEWANLLSTEGGFAPRLVVTH